MKKFLALIFLIVYLFFINTQPVQAHILQSDGSIGAVLHIDPADDPVAGQQSSFFFEFKDTENKFSPEKCDCKFSVVENGNEIFSQPVFQNNNSPSLTSASVFFTFPEINVYKIVITGKPISKDTFSAFTLNYDIRVAKENKNINLIGTNKNWFSSHIFVILTMLIAVFIILANFLKRSKK